MASVKSKRKFKPWLLLLIAVPLVIVGIYVVYRAVAANADINGDGTVNISDLSVLASNFGGTGKTFAQGDLNADGSVNILDFSILAFNWGTSTSTSFGQASGTAFDPNSAFNTPIASNPTIDVNSSLIVASLSTQAGIANIYNWGAPVYNATSSSPRYTFVDSSMTESWCTGKMNNVTGIPIPTGATPSPGSGSAYDGAMVVIDWAQSPAHIYEFYRFQTTPPSGSTITAGCAIKRTSYLGEGNDSDVSKFSGSRGSDTTGSKFSRLAGVVRSWEVAALGSGSKQHLDHALSFSTSRCKGSGGTGPFRYPALKSDGKAGFGNEMIEEGARIQLDPTFNVNTITNPVERGIARTLQVYGAFAMDCGGATMAYIFDAGLLESGDPYRDYSFGGSERATDYRMNAIPWNRLRVIAKQNRSDFYP